MSKNNEYKPGNPEYDFWNDKSLYPSLRHDDEIEPRRTQGAGSDTKIGFGTVFLVVFVWLLILAPFALFCTWEDTIFKVIFWGGVVLVGLVFVISMGDAIQEEKRKKK